MTPHEKKYENIAQTIGIENIIHLMPASREAIAEALKIDKNLNNIELRLWTDSGKKYTKDYQFDAKHEALKEIIGDIYAKQWGAFLIIHFIFMHHYREWTLVKYTWEASYTVCLLKHVAIYHYIKDNK